MKSIKCILIVAAGIGAIAAGQPTAGEITYPSWEACVLEAVDQDPGDHWYPVCVANGDGTWKIAWANAKRGGPRR
jgi:hypothetical protein